jgi:hypothetical protein
MSHCTGFAGHALDDRLHRAADEVDPETLSQQRDERVDQSQNGERHDTDPDTPADQRLLDRQKRLGEGRDKLGLQILVRRIGHHTLHDAASGGFTPANNSHELTIPTQIMTPNGDTKLTADSLPGPPAPSFRTLEPTPIEMTVGMKTMT